MSQTLMPFMKVAGSIPFKPHQIPRMHIFLRPLDRLNHFRITSRILTPGSTSQPNDFTDVAIIGSAKEIPWITVLHGLEHAKRANTLCIGLETDSVEFFQKIGFMEQIAVPIKSTEYHLKALVKQKMEPICWFGIRWVPASFLAWPSSPHQPQQEHPQMPQMQ